MRGFNLKAILLTMIGIALAATGSFSFEERQELINQQNGNMSIKAHPTNNWPWLVGAVAVISGLGIFVLKAKKKN